MQGAPRTKQYYCSFRGAPKFSRINDFHKSILGKEWEMKKGKSESRHNTF